MCASSCHLHGNAHRGEGRDAYEVNRTGLPIAPTKILPLPPVAHWGAEREGEVGDSRAVAHTHLTSPLLRNESLSPQRAERDLCLEARDGVSCAAAVQSASSR